MGTRVCSCVRVRSRAGADDAIIRGMCASAMRSLRKAIHRWNTHGYSICVHKCMHVSISMRVWLSRRTDRRCGPAAHAPTCCVRARARVCVCGWVPTHPRRTVRARSVGGLPRVTSARRRSTRRTGSTRTLARGTPRVSPTCPRYAPPFRPGRRATAGRTHSAGVSGSSMRRGPSCAAGPPMRRGRVCVRRRVGTRMRGRPRV
jgi:hypothetical protein